jgi:hypothetical protein
LSDNLILFIPAPPPVKKTNAMLSLNRERTLNRFTRHLIVKQWRELTVKILREEHGLKKEFFTNEFLFTGPVILTFRPYKAKGILADAGNYYPCCKAITDGLIDAGLIKDDAPQYVASLTQKATARHTRDGIQLKISGWEQQ